MQDCSVLSKGSFSTFRFNDFVSVRQYLLVRENGRKYLLLKLTNEAKSDVTGIKLHVEQIDVGGEVISSDHITIDNVNGKAGTSFVLGEKIPLKEACIEVTINLVGASYGKYEYTVKSNELVIKYKEREVDNKDYSKLIDGNKTVVTKDRFFAVPKILTIIAVLLVAVSVVLAYFQMGKFTVEGERFLWSDVYYEFVDPDRDPEAGVIAVSNAGITGNVVIPKEIEGYKVVGIKERAFAYSSTIFSVTIEANIDIPSEAFAQCWNLKSVELNGPTNIGNDAFKYCGQLQSFKAHNVTRIGAGAFNSCHNLTSLTITADQGNHLDIGDGAFNSCAAIEDITIEQYVSYNNGVEYFSCGESIKSLHLKNFTNRTIASMFDYVPYFYNLETIIIEEMEAIPDGFCHGMTALESVTIKGITNTVLSDNAFKGCYNLSQLNLFDNQGENVKFTEIGEYALSATKIVEFDLSRVNTIGDYAFAYNAQLLDVGLSIDSNLTKIGKGAFRECLALSSFAISDVTMEIGDFAFYQCFALNSFNIGEYSALQKIGESAFEDCFNLQFFDAPQHLKTIGACAFKDCRQLPDFNFCIELETIGERAFQGCEAFESIIMHDTVKIIGTGAFADCVNVKEITIPFVGRSLNQPSQLSYMFSVTGSNSASVVPQTLTSVKVLKGSIGEYAFYGLSQLKEVEIPLDAKYIGVNAFYGCKNIRQINVPSNIIDIEDGAFENCYRLFEIRNESNLTITCGSDSWGSIAKYAIAVYDSNDQQAQRAYVNDFEIAKANDAWYIIDYVGDSADWVTPVSFASPTGTIIREYNILPYLFMERSDVESVAISVAVKSIGEHAFEGCANLAKVSFAKNCQIDVIKQYTFSNSVNLKTVELSDNIKNIEKHAFSSTAITDVELPNVLETIGEFAFSSTNLNSLIIPENVTNVGYGALANCNNLKTLTVPFVGNTFDHNTSLSYVYGYNYNNVLEEVTVTNAQNIGNYAFSGFSGLRKVSVANGIETIGESAFEGCYELTDFVIPKSVVEIGARAFYDCNNYDADLHSSLQKIGHSAFSNTAITSVKLTKNLISLGDWAFSGCKKLTNVDFSACKNITEVPSNCFNSSNVSQANLYGSSIVSIGSGAFENCRRLSKIRLGLSTEIIGDRAFYYTLKLTELTLPQELTTIGNEAFAYSNISTFIFKGDLYSIGDRAFYSSNGLTIVDVDSEVLSYIGDYAFGRCAKLATATIIANNITSLGEYLFSECDKLESATITAPQLEVITGTFSNCSNLSQIDLSLNNLREIGNSAFYACQNITSFTIPNLVTIIKSDAFAHCYNLAWIKLSNELKVIEASAFDSCDSLLEVFNPSSMNIERDSYSNGGVALNAVVVHDSLSDAFINKEIVTLFNTNTGTAGVFTFYYAPDVCCLYSYEGNLANVSLSEIDLGGKVYASFYVRKGVFQGNIYLNTLDTGAVSEIGQNAFSNCVNLRKVIVNYNLANNKVHSTAFSGCYNLWDVQDLNANYNITVGSSGCGSVARYALAVNENITFVESNGYKLFNLEGKWYLYAGIKSTKKVILPESFDVNGTKIEQYILFAHSKVNNSGVLSNVNGFAGNYVVVPKSVVGIVDGAFVKPSNSISLPIIYYAGNQDDWQAMSVLQKGLNPYFYAPCIHSELGDTMVWTFDANSQPTINDTPFNEQGVCEVCNRRILIESSLGEHVELNSTDSDFKIDSDGRVYCEQNSEFGRFDSTLNIIAKTKVNITFKLVSNIGENERVSVLLNNEEVDGVIDSSSIYPIYNLTLNRADFLSISLARTFYYGDACSVSVEQISIVEFVEE